MRAPSLGMTQISRSPRASLLTENSSDRPSGDQELGLSASLVANSVSAEPVSNRSAEPVPSAGFWNRSHQNFPPLVEPNVTPLPSTVH